MGFHHVALAVTDLQATHDFYTEAMGFTLVKAVAGPTDGPEGWAKHLFYDTGGDGMIAFWELHDPRVPDVFDPRISEGLGLPSWVNHIAFHAPDVADFEARREHWLDLGIDVFELDHGFCRSIYATDPSGILVEWCTDTAPYTEADRVAALAALANPAPEFEPMAEAWFHSRAASGGGDVADAGVAAG